MTRLIDINHRLFSEGNDFVDLVETDEICRIAAGGSAPSKPVVEGYSASFAVHPPTYYSLSNGVADNRRINDVLLRIGAAWEGRIVGVAEPKYGEPARDEIRRIAGLGASGIVWSPRAQGVFANDTHMADLCRFVAGLGLVSMIQTAPYSINESLTRIWHLAASCPDAPMVVLGALASWENIQTMQQNRGGPENLFYDTSGLCAARDMEGVVVAMGADRLVFGSGGRRLLAATLGIVESCSFDAAAKEAILSRNAAGLLGLRS